MIVRAFSGAGGGGAGGGSADLPFATFAGADAVALVVFAGAGGGEEGAALPLVAFVAPDADGFAAFTGAACGAIGLVGVFAILELLESSNRISLRASSLEGAGHAKHGFSEGSTLLAPATVVPDSEPRVELQDAAERMPLEQVAELEIFAEYVEALVAAEPLQLGRVYAAIHAGGERPALEAVPA